ncbi:SRPBCC family protein [Pseudomonas corrugata]|uniref:SRPBCC family protein n=1 Tax=Pseudomonas corrugata TaxID=47879 RepID=UPI0028C4FF2F|nr:SRPBCC family protein [Pseudomonas corrugata]MDU9022952.1 SRPBCC family protein [Pseudomonas corrugata]
MTERPPLVAGRAAVPSPSHPNLGMPERAVSLLAGTLLIATGLRQGGLRGWPQVLLGACAAWRAYSGACRVKQALTHSPFEQAFEQDRGWDSSKVISRSITIGKPREGVFAFCRNPANLGALVPWVDTIEQTGERTYRWEVHGPRDKILYCDLEQSEPKEGRKLHWVAAPGTRFKHDIQMHFSDAPTGRGTQIKIIVACQPCFGAAGYALAAAISRFSDKALLHLLRSIKQQLETGEVITNRIRPRGEKDFLFIHPASSATPSTGPSPTPINGEAA